MSSLFSAAKEALDTAKDAKTLEAVRERLAYAHEKLADAERKLVELTEENTDLLRENRELSRKLIAAQSEKLFIDGGACLFKKRDDGTVEETPICHKCKLPIARTPLGIDAYRCNGCGAIFSPLDIKNSYKNAAGE